MKVKALEAVSKPLVRGSGPAPCGTPFVLALVGLRAIGDPASGVTRPLREVLKPILIFFYFSVLLCQGAVAGEEWKEHKCSHFILYYKQADMTFITRVEEMAEYYYDRIARDLGFTRYKNWTWDDRARIYIYDDAQDYVTSGRQMEWSSGTASATKRTIRTFPAAHGFFDSTLPHELGHIIFREFVGFKARIPIWFEEGVAMYQEQARRWGAHETARAALQNGTFMPLNEMALLQLSDRTENDLVQLFYAESASIIHYMMSELGQERFVRLCRKLQEGNPFDWTLESVYVRFKDSNQLNDAWVKFLKQ